MPVAPSYLPKSTPRSGLLSTLIRRLRPSSHTAAGGNAAAPTRIGIEGLPKGVNELPRQVPVALVAADESSAEMWFPALIEDAVAAGPVGLVAPSTEWADELLLRQPLRDAYRSGQLLLWVLSPGLQSEMKRHGLGLLLNELERTGLKDQHALYVCDAQHLLSGLSLTQIARVSGQLSTLCQERQQPVVLGFFPPLEIEVLLTTLRNLCHLSMHIATLRADAERWSLGLERWNSAAGAIFQTAFGLVHNATSGRLVADGTRTRGAASELVEAVDQFDVIATRASVDRQRGVPSHWRIVENLVEIQAAAASSVAATVVVDAGQDSDFEALARLVHHLRLSRPPTLKIVVRENLGKLRMHSEQALLQLGASAVVYKEVGFSRLLQLLKDINAQSHTREVNPDYGQAVEGFLPPDVRGYQPPALFCSLVRDMLNRTQSMGLSHSLVQLNMMAQTPHLDALHACYTSRNGDLFTADHEAVYVFLFACREPDIELALNRLFTMPLTQLFASEAIDCSDAGIRAMTDHLQESMRKGSPDYSTLLNSSLHLPSSSSSPRTPHPVAVLPIPMAIASAPGATTWPAKRSAPSDTADPVSMAVRHTATGPSVQPRPIARRTAPQPSPGSAL